MSFGERRPPPVIFVTHAFEDARTGPAVYARYLWQCFADDPRFEFHVVAPDGPAGHPRFHVARSSHSGSRAFYQELIRTALSLADRIGRPGILHLNAPHYAFFKKPFNWKLWLQINDYEGPQLLRHPLDNLIANGPRRFGSLLVRRWVERRMLRRCDLALANSDYTRRETITGYPELASIQFRTLYKAVDLDFFQGARIGVRPPGSCRFAYVGSNFRLKQLHLVLEAFATLPAIGSSLRIAGCTREEFVRAYPGLEKASQSAGVTFHGRLGRVGVRDLLLSSDALLLPSRQEALGVVALEAIACECRVIGARVGGIPEIIDSPEVGRLVDEPTLTAWRSAMAAEVAEATAMGAARRLLLERFSTRHMLAELRGHYLNSNFNEPTAFQY